MSRPINELSATNRAFLSLICAIVWLLVVPTFFVVGFCKALRAQNDHRDQLSGADWGNESSFHGSNDNAF